MFLACYMFGNSSFNSNVAFHFLNNHVGRHIMAIIQDDNVKIHQAQFVKQWFSEHEESFSCMNWPPQSPELNSI